MLVTFLKGMVGINVPLINSESIYYLQNSLILLGVAFLGISPFIKNKIASLKKGKIKKVIEIGEIIYIFALFIISVSCIVSSSFNPFIYFRF